MRRHVGNTLIRARRELRFVLVDRYRALLVSRFTVLTTLVAAGADIALGLLSTVRRRRRRAVSPAGTPTVLVGTVTGRDLSLVLRGVPHDLTGLTLRTGSGDVDLDTIVLPGDAVVRVIATLPAAGVGATALAARTPTGLLDIAGAQRWLAVTPSPVAVVPTVEMGVRTVTVSWSGATSDTALLLVDGDGHETVCPAEVRDGEARALLDLREIADAGRWTAWVRRGTTRVPLALPLDRFPTLERAPLRHRVRLPAPGARGRVAEVGWGEGNQLTLRVDDSAAP